MRVLWPHLSGHQVSVAPEVTFAWAVTAGAIIFIVVVFAIGIPLSLRATRKLTKAGPTMTMSFDVGTGEKHVVHIAYTQVTLRLVVVVDGEQFVDKPFSAGFASTVSFEFGVGVHERHTVTLTKRRARVYSAFRPQLFVASVDGVKVAEAESQLRGAVSTP